MSTTVREPEREPGKFCDGACHNARRAAIAASFRAAVRPVEPAACRTGAARACARWAAEGAPS